MNSTVSAALGLEAGVDMDNMCGKNDDDTWAYQHVESAVALGAMPPPDTPRTCTRHATTADVAW